MKKIGFFERYLTLWVILCIFVGIEIGKIFPGPILGLSQLEYHHVNIIMAILLWLMIYPMMLKIDFSALLNVGKKPKGILITLFVNWLVKPFSMAFLAWFFLTQVFAAWITPSLANEYMAGTIILAAAPCTAMVFVWSYLTDGDPAYTLVQVALNDLLMLFLFAPIIMLLLGMADVSIPLDVLFASVGLYIVIPLFAGIMTRKWSIRRKGEAWFVQNVLDPLRPLSTMALLATLVLIFAFQGERITNNWFNILLIAVPIIIQVYFNAALAYGLSYVFRVPHTIAAPSALIGASNFFELAVAVTISLFGLSSGATLAAVVGVLVEVPVMLSICRICNRSKSWFQHREE